MKRYYLFNRCRQFVFSLCHPGGGRLASQFFELWGLLLAVMMFSATFGLLLLASLAPSKPDFYD